jgi:hypothetical protein
LTVSLPPSTPTGCWRHAAAGDDGARHKQNSQYHA